jgi:hypothetical protein
VTALSVVVANRATTQQDIAPHVASLKRELAAQDQIVWVDSLGLRPPAVELTSVTPPPGSGRGEMYRSGLDACRLPLVAFTDSATVLQPGWRRAAVGALTSGAAVVGGPVLPGHLRPLRTVAGFFVEYGPHAAPPFVNAGHDVSANNVAYQRSVLESTLQAGEPVRKNFVNARLSTQGSPPRLVEGMSVVSAKLYGWRDLGPIRVAHGRLYGAVRAQHWSVLRRVAATTGCVALPIVAYLRLAVVVWREPALRASFVLSAPLVLAALAAWSAGEADGYLFRKVNSSDVF